MSEKALKPKLNSGLGPLAELLNLLAEVLVESDCKIAGLVCDAREESCESTENKNSDVPDRSAG